MMLIGTATFTSCGDDEGNNNDGNNGDTSSQITLVEKYKDIKEATIVGDDVLYPDPIFQGMIAVYHFNGNKIESAKMYIKTGNEVIEKAIKEEYSAEDGYDITIEGGYIIINALDEEELMEMQGITKQELIEELNEEQGFLFEPEEYQED